MDKVLAKLGEGGRLVIPAEYRKILGIDTGDELALTMEEGALRITTPKEGVRRARALIRSYIPEGRRLSDELIEERRRASRDEQGRARCLGTAGSPQRRARG